MVDIIIVKHCDAIGSCFCFPMAITINFINSLCFPILLFLCILFMCIPLLQCSPSYCLDDRVSIFSDNSSILVSPGGVFELGFFAPDEKAENRTYLGIWYHNQSNPKIVVWVANRDRPLVNSNGYLLVEPSEAKVCDDRGEVYWSTGGNPSRMPKFTNLCLDDTGNLILSNRKESRLQQILWQSFEYPTDTLLPGMTANNSIDFSSTSLNLTSWKDRNNPAPGNFRFPLQPNLENQLYIVEVGMIGKDYWQSRLTPFDKLPLALLQLWFDVGSHPFQNNTRLVMNFTGQLQFWSWDVERGWSLEWSEPKDNCSVSDKCGYFGSCNSNNEKFCKCLPGFKPSANYSLGETSGGCSLTSGNICDRDNRRSDIFLKLSKMKVGNQTCTPTSFSEGNCTDQCLNDCHCVAYSDVVYSDGYAGCSLTGTSTVNKCLKWSDKLTDLQEDYEHGITIFVRTTRSDIDPTSRGCSPCGTSIIPYPLSTGRNCGDPWYFNFQCNAVTGQLNFLTQSSNFRVTKIDPDANIFSIQVMHASCDSRYINSSVLSPNRSSPFTARDCRVKFQPLAQVDRPSIEVDISWRPPLEFSCNTPSDCIQWPNTRCKRTNEGKMRCICRPKYNWNGTKLECIHRKRVLFPPKIAVPCIAGASAIFLVCFIYLVYVIRKRRIAHKQDMFEFKGDDSEAIDVPFFDWEVILAATNNFADANRLGIGGFGSVYMGKLLDGQQIAVKRLSSVSVQGVEEFRTEVVLIAKLQHRNLVKLLGYCMKSEEKILVYEFMPNGSLDACLFDEKHSVYLDWKKRFDIIVGIARGLLYLHQDSRLRIIHRDLKPSNILLDEELNPKISDFGIARIVGGKDTQASTGRVVGTYGYMSPEYAYEGIFSIKSDVFSFGVVILETISGRRNSRIFMFEHGLSLLGYAWKLWNEDKGLELLDPKLKELCFPSEVQKCINIGLLCVQEDPSDRPTMSTVVYMLSGENASLPLAKQPAFMNRKPLSDTASSSSAKNLSMHEVMTVSTVGR